MKPLLLSVLCLVCMATTPTLFAQTTLIVNSSLDDANSRDANPGDGVCSDMNNRCTLRAAIDEANASSGEVTIVLPGRLPGGVVGQYTLSRVAPNMMSNTYEDANEFGDLDINGSFSRLDIRGTGTPGPVLSVSPNDRIMHVGQGMTVNLSRIQFTGGTARAGSNGVANPGSGEMVDGEDGEDGGALYVGENAVVTLDQLTFNGNTTQSGGNGATPASGISRTTGGDAGSGGNGGALFIARGADVEATRCTFYQNGTGDAGGAGSGQGMDADGGAGGCAGNGGAIYAAGTITLRSCTVNANNCGDPGAGGPGVNGGSRGMAGDGGSGGGIASGRVLAGTLVREGTVRLENTIVAGNTSGDDQNNGKQPGTDMFDANQGRTIANIGYNLVGSDDAIPDFAGAATTLLGTAGSLLDPVITGLNRNDDEAVPTLTLGAMSPALNAGATIGDNDYDARGFVRPADGTQADIGATEANSSPTPVDIMIAELDVNNSGGGGEFVEIENRGEYTVQLDDYVLVGFGSASNTSCLTANLYAELEPGEVFVIADDGVDNRDQPLTFDVPANSCGSSMGNQFDNTSGAVGLYFGDGTNFTGFTAGSRTMDRIDVLVYDNGNTAARGTSGSLMNDLCGDFGLGSGCAATDAGDGESIQVTSDGQTVSSTPSPGEVNGSANVLPVAWLGFTATSTKVGTVDLWWATAREENNEGYLIEYAQAGQDWRDAGWQDALPNALTGGEYTHEMIGLAAGTYTFRLRQRDFDGTESFSDLATVRVLDDRAVAVYPNPVSTALTVNLNRVQIGEVADLSVLDALGRPVLTRRNETSPAVTFDVSTLAKGNYYLRVRTGDQTVVRPIYVR